MKQTTHTRKGHIIRRLAVPAFTDKNGKEFAAVPEKVDEFQSINRAKRESRALQKKGAVLRLEPRK